MRKINLLVSTAIVLIALFVASCSAMKDLEYDVKQNPIEMHADKVSVNIDGKFIEKGLNKKVFVTLTPTLVNAAGDELEFDARSFKGEQAAGNGEIVKKDGHNFSYSSTRPYDPRFENAELIVKYIALKAGKEKLNDRTPKIADGTVVTALSIKNDDKVLMGKDNLIRREQKLIKAVINYNKAEAILKPGESTDIDIMALETFLTEANFNSKIVLNGIDILSFASPEGETYKNANLASDRSLSAEQHLFDASARLGLNLNPLLISKMPKGEDWEGLKELIANSDHEDKNIIISVAEMETDADKREQEIRALSSTYLFLDREIFPQLRRSQIILNYTEYGLTDDEFKAIAKSDPNKLSVEELLFSGELSKDNDEKLKLYKTVIKKNPSDWRGYTNAGAILYKKGMNTEANEMFTKAFAVEKNAITSNNMGVVKRQAGDIAGATELFGDAIATNEVAKYNLGLINIKKGEYNDAVANMGSSNTYNKALAYTLKKDYKNAGTTLMNSTDKNTAKGLYLKAIIAARLGTDKEVISSLTEAIAKDNSLRTKAKKDREFVRYFNNALFMAL